MGAAPRLVAWPPLLLLLASVCHAVVTSPLQAPRYALASASANGTIIFAGGNDTVPSAAADIYILRGPKLNSSLSAPRMDLAGAGVGTTIMFAGGKDTRNASAVVDIWDTLSMTWTSSSLSVGRSLLCGAAIGNKIVFAGGGTTVAVDTVDIYDTTTNAWSTGALSAPRFLMACAAAGQKIVFAGGFNGQNPFSVADIYDTIANTWVSVPNALSTARFIHAAGAAGTKIVFAGGQDATGPSGAVDIYDVVADTWTRSPYRLSVPRLWLTGIGCLDKIFFAGGTNNTYSFSVFDVHDVGLNLWISTATNGSPFLSTPRLRLASAAAETLVMFAGGSAATPLAIAEYIFSCRGIPPAVPAICIAGVWVIPPNVTVINATRGQPITVNGSLDLVPVAVVVVNTAANATNETAVITVNGTANVDGTLTIVLADVPTADTFVPVLTADAINGTFATIEVKTPPTCARLSGSQVVDASGTLGALISVDSRGCKGGKKGGLSGGSVAGIVVGILILLVVLGIGGGYLLMRHCKAAKPLFRKPRTRAQTYSATATDV